MNDAVYIARDYDGSQWSLTFEVRKRIPDQLWEALTDWSQWSLTFEVRKSPGRVVPPGIVALVAMEPDL